MMLLHRKPNWSVIAVVFALTVVPMNSIGEHVETEDVEFSVEFDQSHGAVFVETVAFSGISSQPLRNTTWTIVNISGATPITVLSGPYLTSVSPIAEGAYDWSLVVEVGSIDCTCYVELRTEDADHSTRITSLVFYLGSTHHRPVMVESLPAFSQSADIFLTPTVLRDEVDITLGLVLPSNQSTSVQVFGEICEAPYEVCLETPRQVAIPSTYSEGRLVLDVNRTVLEITEGRWQIDVSVADDVLRTSSQIRLLLIHDVTPPLVQLTVPEIVTEATPFHIFANVSDGYEGASYSISWALTQVDDSVRAPAEDEFFSPQQLHLNLTQSGRYTVSVTVIDATGLSAKHEKTFVVENIKPIASIEVDGLKITSGATIKLGPEGNWSLNAQDSMDNEAVEYLWVINDALSIRGVPTLGPSDFPDAGKHSVELIVFDDDGATDSWTIEVVILQSSNPEETSSALAMVGVGILGVLLVVAYLNIRRPSSTDSVLPKWQDRNLPIGVENDGFLVDRDATIEEDKARG